MQCKCGGLMIERSQNIDGKNTKYLHCKACTRNYVKPINQLIKQPEGSYPPK